MDDRKEIELAPELARLCTRAGRATVSIGLPDSPTSGLPSMACAGRGGDSNGDSGYVGDANCEDNDDGDGVVTTNESGRGPSMCCWLGTLGVTGSYAFVLPTDILFGLALPWNVRAVRWVPKREIRG